MMLDMANLNLKEVSTFKENGNTKNKTCFEWHCGNNASELLRTCRVFTEEDAQVL